MEGGLDWFADPLAENPPTQAILPGLCAGDPPQCGLFTTRGRRRAIQRGSSVVLIRQLKLREGR